MRPTFRDLIAANKRNSVILVALFCLFTAGVAGVLALGTIAYVSPATVRHLDVGQAVAVGLAAAAVALLFALFGYYEGDRMILAVSHARPIDHAQDPELYNVVEEMAIAAGVPMPQVYLIPDEAPNAFATGRDPEHAAVAVTRGLREQLPRDELQGVIAHEMSHVRNYDIRLMLLMTVLVGTVAMLADFFWQITWNTSPRRERSDRDRDKSGGGGIVLVLAVLAVVLAILAPIVAQVIQFAVSRQREYLADATGVEFTRNPLGLASALRKISKDAHQLKYANQGTAHLYIVNPIKKFSSWADTAFASHPPIEDRIRRLEALVQ
jgi:heat shock protein HtpX